MTTSVAILGATGLVGQKLVRMIHDHPHFDLGELAASERNKGKIYGEVVSWREEVPLPQKASQIKLCSLKEVRSPFALSALPSEVARTVEPLLASNGTHVVSNASALRMEPFIPLLIPEVNRDHLHLIKKQKTSGKIVTNPNCATVFACLALAPLLSMGELKHISLTTLQAISGAGMTGLASMDILGNIIPNILDEEDKIQEETKKILGDQNTPASFGVTVHVNRVPVMHGHTIILHLTFKSPIYAHTISSEYEKWNHSHHGLYQLHQDDFRPQPQKDIHSLDQRTHIGRIKQGDHPHVVGLIAQGHNLVRGAAGAALLNLEALLEYLSS